MHLDSPTVIPFLSTFSQNASNTFWRRYLEQGRRHSYSIYDYLAVGVPCSHVSSTLDHHH